MFTYHKSEKEFLHTFVPMLKKEWITDARRVSDLTFNKGKDMPRSVVMHRHFVPICMYIDGLFRDLRDNKLKMKWIHEVDYWEKKGGLCILLSVLTYALFQKMGVANEQSMRYVQGYYQHKSRTDSWIVSMFPENHIGLHAWITIEGAVVDMSIRQEEQFFDFGETPYIIGTVPEGMSMIGFSEPKKTVNKYIEMFAKIEKVSTEEWVERHIDEMNRFTAELD